MKDDWDKIESKKRMFEQQNLCEALRVFPGGNQFDGLPREPSSTRWRQDEF